MTLLTFIFIFTEYMLTSQRYFVSKEILIGSLDCIHMTLVFCSYSVFVLTRWS